MNEHTIRHIARVGHEADRAYGAAALGIDKPEFDALPDVEMDEVVEYTRNIIEHMSDPAISVSIPVTKKVQVAVIKALVQSEFI